MSDNTALIAEIEANLQTIRNSRANGQLPSDERVQLLSRAVTALYQSERDRTQAITDAITAEDQANNLAGDVAQLERELADQAAAIHSIRMAAGQKDWKWVYQALNETHTSGTESTR